MSGSARGGVPAGFVCLGGLLIGLVPAAALAKAAPSVPIPLERPADAPGAAPPPEAAAGPSPCQLKLAARADFEPLPPITGPGQCQATDVVQVNAVLLPGKRKVTISPPATLRCPMAEAVSKWIAEDVAPAIAATGTSLRDVETVGSFDCRTRDSIPGAKISEHGRADALDLRAFKLANGAVIALNDPSASKPLRESFRASACARFSTVLGNGADAYHNTHVHIDMIERSNNYKICEWDILDPAETAVLAKENAAKENAAARQVSLKIGGGAVPLPPQRPLPNADAESTSPPSPQRGDADVAQSSAPLSLAAASVASNASSAGQETVTVGPWSIATAYEGDKFVGCSMSRSTSDLDASFRQSQDGLALILASPKWKLQDGSVYPVRLVAGYRSVAAQATAAPESVTIPMEDRSLAERLRAANVLEVIGKGATLRVPLDGSTVAFERLQACFNKNSRNSVETNPFVAPSRKP